MSRLSSYVDGCSHTDMVLVSQSRQLPHELRMECSSWLLACNNLWHLLNSLHHTDTMSHCRDDIGPHLMLTAETDSGLNAIAAQGGS